MSGPSSSASRTSLPSVKIGSGSFSPGDVFVESILPRVQLVLQSPYLSAPSSSSSSQPQDSNGVKLQSSPSMMLSGSSDQQNDEDDVLSRNSRTETSVLPLRDHPAIRRAQDECATLLNGNDVSTVDDEDVKEEVVQLSGHDAELVFPCRNIFRYVVLFLKDMHQFVEIYVDVLDEKQTYRQLKITNARSLAKVETSACQLPMVMGQKPGWRYVCLDLRELTRRAFGSKHVTTTQLRITGHCRLLRIFFQDEQYSDAELPPYLTFLGS